MNNLGVVSKNIALKLKELGFNEDTIFSYSNINGTIVNHLATTSGCDTYISKGKYDRSLPAPLYQQVFQWFRDEHGIGSYVMYKPQYDHNNDYYSHLESYVGVIKWIDMNDNLHEEVTLTQDTYQEAQDELIKLLINQL